MKILVCGGREFDDWERLNKVLNEVYDTRERDSDPMVVVQGGAKGADFLAKVWAKYMRKNHNISYKEYPANWKKHGRPAGIIRNQQMLDENKIDLVVAFSGGDGTKDMIRRAKRAKIEVMKIESD